MWTPDQGCPCISPYGLDREQTVFVLDDFHRVQNPRVMDEDYFEMYW